MFLNNAKYVVEHILRPFIPQVRPIAGRSEYRLVRRHRLIDATQSRDYTRLAAKYLADSLHPTNGMHRFAANRSKLSRKNRIGTL